MTALAVSALTLRYPGTAAPAVAQLSLDVPAGTCLALLGPSGSGKSTVLRAIAGLMAPDSGDVTLDGRSVLSVPPEARGTVMVFQTAHLFPTMTVAANVGFGLRMRGLPRDEVAARVARMLALVQLDALADRMPDALSGGQAQRVALARALVVAPAVLLLDEPVSHLDPALRDDMRALIAGLRQATGVTTLVVTHDPADALALADRVALMAAGRILQAGSMEDLVTRPATAAVARFFGAPNLFPAEVRGGWVTCPLGRFPTGRPDGPACVSIRPEAVVLGPGPAARPATVLSRRHGGDRVTLEFRVEGAALTGSFRPDQAQGAAAGTTVAVTLPPEAVWIMPPAA